MKRIFNLKNYINIIYCIISNPANRQLLNEQFNKFSIVYNVHLPSSLLGKTSKRTSRTCNISTDNFAAL